MPVPRRLNPHWIVRGWVSLFRRSQVEREMDEEMRFHLECRADELRRTLALTPEEAMRRARLEFGGVGAFKEQSRQAAFGMRVLEDILRDVTYALRSLRRTPGFTLTAAVTIALGVAVNAALFSVVYAVRMRPLPIVDPGGARNVYLEARGEGRRRTYGTHFFASFAEFHEMRERSRTTDLAGVAEARVVCPCRPGAGLRTQLVSDNLLPLIGARPVLGRFFAPYETSTIGSAPVIVLSYAAWQQIFAADPAIVGRSLMLNRTMFTVIGVADAETTGPLLTKPDLWMPLTMHDVTRPGDGIIADPAAGWIQMIARLRPGVSDAEVQAELALLGQQAVSRHSPRRTAIVSVRPAAFMNYPDIGQGAAIIGLFFVAVGLVLLIGCLNVANMLLARGFTRRREVAIRLAIGAGRRRLFQQFLVESIVLGLLGGALGLALSQIAARVVLASLPPEAMAHRLDVSPDWHIVGYTALVSLFASLVFGAVPALRLLRQDVAPVLKSDVWHVARARARRAPSLQALLVAGQMAVTLMLLVNAGLLLRGFERAQSMDRGQLGRNVLITSLDLMAQQYGVERAIALHDALRARAREAPGVQSVSLTGQEPLTSFSRTRLRWDGAPESQGITVSADEVGLDYFETMRIALLRGRAFEPADLREGATALIVDEPLARALAAANGGRDVLGRRVQIGDRRHDIVGIVAATRGLHPAGDRFPRIFRPLQGRAYLWARVVLHYDGPREPIVAALRQAVKELDPDVPVTIKPIEENVAAVMQPLRIIAAIVSSLGLLGLVLGCTGLYGVVAFTVGRRRRELGIRLTLGATRAQVMRLVMGYGLLPVMIGGAVGLLLAAGTSMLLRAVLYGLSPLDPIAFGTTTLALMVSATIAALLPARAALTVDPSETLRHE